MSRHHKAGQNNNKNIPNKIFKKVAKSIKIRKCLPTSLRKPKDRNVEQYNLRAPSSGCEIWFVNLKENHRWRCYRLWSLAE